MLGTIIVIIVFALTGLGLYAAAKEKLGKVGSSLSSGLGALAGYALETTSGYSFLESPYEVWGIPHYLLIESEER